MFKVYTQYYHIWYAYINRVNIMNVLNRVHILNIMNQLASIQYPPIYFRLLYALYSLFS